jgi:hypothetical protein
MTPAETLRRERAKACRVCRDSFVPARPMQRVCSPACALSLATSQRARAEKRAQVQESRDIRARKARLKTRSDWMREAQAAFNTYIRARDEGKPCICCGGTSSGWTRGGDWDAGHFRSRGAAPHLRFHEDNCHAQLKRCNRRAFDVAGYRRNLVERIGLAQVEALESDNEMRKWTMADLQAIRDEYRQRVKAMRQIDETSALDVTIRRLMEGQ